MNEVVTQYDKLIEENNDPVNDPKPLQDYMDKWDGQVFIDKMHLDSNKTVLEIGVGTGRIAVKVAPLCKAFTGILTYHRKQSRELKNTLQRIIRT